MSDMDSDDEDDAYDLRDVSSDVEMHPDDLDAVDSDAGCVPYPWLSRVYSNFGNRLAASRK